MAWTPTPEIEQAVERLCARARERAARAANDAINDLAERDAARRSIGGVPAIGVIQLREEELRNSIQPAIDDAFDFFENVYGAFPPGAVPWMRGQFVDRIDQLSAETARGLAGLYSRGDARGGARLADEKMRQIAAGLKRDLEIRLAPIEIRAGLRELASGTLPSDAPGPRKFDVFISHASEDLDAVTQPLFDLLTADGYVVWLDRVEIKVGMSLFNTIDNGLATSRFGVVVLSPSFFAKSWTRRELGAIAVLGDAEGKSRLLPVWHELTQDDVVKHSPFLADIRAVSTRDGLEKVVSELKRAIGPPQASQGQNAGTNAGEQTS